MQWVSSLKQAAFEPAVFQDVVSQFQGKLPSDELIRPYLIRRGFGANAVDAAIRIIRDNLALLDEYEDVYNGEDAQLDEEPISSPVSIPRHEEQRIPQPREVIGMRQDRFSMAEGVVTLEWPAEISAESAQDIEDWLELVKRKIKRAVSASKPISQAEATADGSDHPPPGLAFPAVLF